MNYKNKKLYQIKNTLKKIYTSNEVLKGHQTQAFQF